MGNVVPTTILSHWNHGTDGLEHSSDLFCGEIERIIGAHNLKDVKIERVHIHEGGILSAKREYLQVRRGSHVFHVCGAPYGNTFFISWWLGHVDSGFMAWLSRLPGIGFIIRKFLKPLTYYQIDTALMFQSITQSAVTMALDAAREAKGIRALTESESKPIMRDFFSSIGTK